jgi:hypothetical protein
MLLRCLQGSGSFKAPHIQVEDVLWVTSKVQSAEKIGKGGKTGKGTDWLLYLRQYKVDDNNGDEEGREVGKEGEEIDELKER